MQIGHVAPTALLLAGVLIVGCASSGRDPLLPERVATHEPSPGWVESVMQPQEPTRTLGEEATLENYLAYAALNNPGLESAFNTWKAELERIPQVTSLPDPRFTYRYYIQEVETRVGPQQHAIEVGQTFPWFGKLELRGVVAAEGAEVARLRYESQKLKLFNEVKQAYYEYYYLGRAIGVVDKMAELVKRFEEVARAKFRVGNAQLADVVRAQVELGKLEDRKQSLEDMRTAAAARLNAAVNRPIGEDRPWPRAIPEESIASGDDEILRMLEARSPELAALDHEAARQRSAAELARKDAAPDLTVGIAWIGTDDALMPGTPDSGKDPVILGLSVNVPIWAEKYRAAEREARRRQWAAIKAKAEKANVLSSRVKRALYDFRDAERKISLYRDTLLPLATESVKTTEAGFTAGTSTFLDLIDTERVLLDFELSLERALANHAQRLAELEMLVGQDLPRGPSTGSGPEENAKSQPLRGEKGEETPEETPEEMKKEGGPEATPPEPLPDDEMDKKEPSEGGP